MKFSIFSLILLFASISLYAQDEPKELDQAIGISGYFINYLLPFEYNVGRSAPYLINYRKYNGENKFTRMGLNVNLDGSVTLDSTKVKLTNHAVGIDYRIGKGKTKKLWKKFDINYGWDLIFNVDIQRNRFMGATSKVTTSLYKFGIGTGPFMGVQYNITKRLVLQTDASFYIHGLLTREVGKTDATPDVVDLDQIISYEELFRTPGHLVLFYKF